MATFQSPPPAYYAPKFPAMNQLPRRPSSQSAPTARLPHFNPTQPLSPDQAKYVKAYNRAVGIYNASPRKDYLPCTVAGCTNVVNNFDSLVIELNLHEIATHGSLCAICTNWFESWEAKDRHMCPGPGGNVPEDDPELPPIMPPVQHMAAADPTFFHQSMKPQQFAIVAARRGMEIRRNSPHALRCDFMGCTHHASSEAGLVEHIFKHFQTAAGGLCASCKHFCANVQEREAHQCSPTGRCSGYDSSGSDYYSSD